MRTLVLTSEPSIKQEIIMRHHMKNSKKEYDYFYDTDRITIWIRDCETKDKFRRLRNNIEEITQWENLNYTEF